MLALASKPMTVAELAAKIYDVEPVALTRSQDVTIRNAIGRLAKGNLVKQSAILARDGAWCWILADAQIREDPRPKLRSVP